LARFMPLGNDAAPTLQDAVSERGPLPPPVVAHVLAGFAKVPDE
jgi:hypothetical protein